MAEDSVDMFMYSSMFLKSSKIKAERKYRMHTSKTVIKKTKIITYKVGISKAHTTSREK